MLKWLFRSRNIQDALNETKDVKIDGVLFKIRRVSVTDHLTGASTLLGPYQTYESVKAAEKASEKQQEFNKKLHDHYRDILMAGIVKPAVTRNIKKEPTKVDVNDILSNGSMAVDLYEAIVDFTYGKKKLKAMGL